MGGARGGEGVAVGKQEGRNSDDQNSGLPSVCVCTVLHMLYVCVCVGC